MGGEEARKERKERTGREEPDSGRQGGRGNKQTGGTSGLYSGRRILDHQALRWGDAQLFCGSEKDVGSRLQALKQVR